MSVLGYLHVAHGDQDRGSHRSREFSAIETAQAHRVSAAGVRVVDGLEDIARVAAAGESHHNVVGLEEILQLLDENILVGDIVGIGCDRGEVIV